MITVIGTWLSENIKLVSEYYIPSSSQNLTPSSLKC